MFTKYILKPFAAISAVALSTLGILSRKYQRARFYYHLTLYVSTLGVLSIWGVIVSLVVPLIGERFNINYIVARSFYHTCSPLIGWKFEVEGEEHLEQLLTAREGKQQSAILVGNHQSFVDILYLGRIFPKQASIMAKKELKWAPLLGSYLFVNRKDRRGAVQALEKAGDDMKKKGICLWIFPEGTRSMSAEPALLPFKKGAFHLAVQAQVPIVAVVCENYHRLFDGRTRMDSGSLKIKVLPPISTVGLSTDDVSSLTESTRELMLKTLKSISAPKESSSRLSPVDDATTTATEEPEGLRRRTEVSDASGKTKGRGTELKSVDSRGGETTEDEMDDDAVLLKRPSPK